MPETPDPSCPTCKGTGSCDSGGETPWGAPVEVRCECTYPEPPIKYPSNAHQMRNPKLSPENGNPATAETCPLHIWKHNVLVDAGMPEIDDSEWQQAMNARLISWYRAGEPVWMAASGLLQFARGYIKAQTDDRAREAIRAARRAALGEKTEHWSDEQRKVIARIDAMIAWHAGECGVGPKCELPSLADLIADRAAP